MPRLVSMLIDEALEEACQCDDPADEFRAAPRRPGDTRWIYKLRWAAASAAPRERKWWHGVPRSPTPAARGLPSSELPASCRERDGRAATGYRSRLFTPRCAGQPKRHNACDPRAHTGPSPGTGYARRAAERAELPAYRLRIRCRHRSSETKRASCRASPAKRDCSPVRDRVQRVLRACTVDPGSEGHPHHSGGQVRSEGERLSADSGSAPCDCRPAGRHGKARDRARQSRVAAPSRSARASIDTAAFYLAAIGAYANALIRERSAYRTTS